MKSSKVNSVDIISSPCMEVQVDEEDSDITLDTGAESRGVRRRDFFSETYHQGLITSQIC